MEKKVLLLLHNFSNGGVQKVIINLEKGLSDLGFETRIAVSNNKGEYQDEVNQEKVYNCGITYGKGDALPLISFFKIYRYIKEWKPDVVIAPPGMFTITNIFYKYMSRKKIKCINIVDNRVSLLKTGKWHHKISFMLINLLYPYSDYTVAAHEKAKIDLKKIKNLNGNKIVKIYHPLIDNENKVKKSTLNVTNRLDKKFRIIGVGRLVPEKSFDNLIRAFKFVQQKSESELLILGEGYEREKLEKLVKELGIEQSVHLLGYVNNPIDYISDSDLFVLSSSQEAFGNVIVEALSVGTKIVATDCYSGGPSEILDSGKYGILCEVNDSQKLAEAILNAQQVFFDKKTLVNRAKDFSVVNSAKKYGDLINE